MYDVIVSGAGPGGACAARECAQLGLSTLLLEKGQLPRLKCCAGGLLQRALNHLNLRLPDDIVQRQIMGFAVEVGAQREEFSFSRRVGVTVRRAQFDHFLAKQAVSAGAELMSGTATKEVCEHKDRVEVETEAGVFQARILIVAEGVSSRTARKLFGPFPPLALATGMAANVSTERDPGDRIELHLIDTPTKGLHWDRFPLNGWMFPHRDGANIGIVGQGCSRERLDASMHAIAEKLEARCGPVVTLDRSAHPLPFRPRPRLHSVRSMAVGDSAGFVNPITGEGMGYAFLSAHLAARTARAVVDTESVRALKLYDRSCQEQILRDLRAAALIGPVLHWLVGVVDAPRFFGRFKEDRALVEVCAGIARGEADWRHLARLAGPRFPRLFFSSLEPVRTS